MLIVGSAAAKFHLPNWRDPKDVDFFSIIAPDAFVDTVYGSLKSDNFWHTYLNGSQLDRDGVATLDELYTIKVSHSYWELKNGSWDKHMYDIFALQNAGAVLDVELHHLLYNIWEDTHGSKRMKFSEKEEFFNDAVPRIYDHDSIHESVAYGDHALYLDFLKQGATVDMDMRRVWEADFETQVKLFKEEIFATALERWLIPKNYEFSPALAYRLALKKTVTSLTRGRSARFIVDNFGYFMKAEQGYLQRHLDKRHKLIKLEM